MASPETSNESLLNEILAGLKALQVDNARLASAVDEINGRVNMLAGVKQVHDAASASSATGAVPMAVTKNAKDIKPAQTVASVSEHYEGPTAANIEHSSRRPSTTSKIILTSYPGQAGVDPLIMNWGHKDPNHRGPVVVSRHSNTIRRRNGKVLWHL